MAEGQVDAVIVGADRIAASGDAANKVGTLGLAIMRAIFEFRFMWPRRKYYRLHNEVGSRYSHRGARSREVLAEPILGVAVRNPAFDVTPYELITAIVTEDGVWNPLES